MDMKTDTQNNLTLEEIEKILRFLNENIKGCNEKIGEVDKKLEMLTINVNRMTRNTEEIVVNNSRMIREDIKDLFDMIEKNQGRPEKTNPVIVKAEAGTVSGERRAGQSLGYKTAENNLITGSSRQTPVPQKTIQSKLVNSAGGTTLTGRQGAVGLSDNLLSALNKSIENYDNKQLREAIVSDYQLELYSCANSSEILSNGDAVVKFQPVKVMGEARYLLKRQGGEGLLLPVPRPKYDITWYNMMKKLFIVEGYERGAYNKIIVKEAAVMGVNMLLKKKGHLVMLN